MERGWNRYDMHLEDDEEMFVRTGAFLRHPDAALPCVPARPRHLPFTRMACDLYYLYKVVGQEFTLTTPYDDSRISEIELGCDESLVIKMDHLLAFSSTTFIQRAWRVDLNSILALQFRYIYLTGPARVVYFGLGDLKEVCIEGESHDYDRGAVIGWTDSLAQGVSTRSTLFSALLAKEQICLSRFAGNGTILTQASTMSKLPKRFHDEHSSRSFIDYLNALLGLGI